MFGLNEKTQCLRLKKNIFVPKVRFDDKELIISLFKIRHVKKFASQNKYSYFCRPILKGG